MRAGMRDAKITVSKSYVVRDAGTGSRLGRIYKTYPYTLRCLLEALDEARLRSCAGPPQVVTVVTGRVSTVIRRYASGREVPVTSLAEPAQPARPRFDHVAVRTPKRELRSFPEGPSGRRADN